MKHLLVLLTTCALFLCTISCSRKVALTKSRVSETRDSIVSTIDTSKGTLVTTETETVSFGDTLTGSFYVPEWMLFDSLTQATITPFCDSIESGGIKVKAKVTRDKSGGIKVNLEAIAKPVTIVNTKKADSSFQKGLSTNAAVHTKTDSTNKGKQVETESDMWKLYVIIGFVALVSGGIYLIINKKRGD